MLRDSVDRTEASDGRLARVGRIDRSIGEPLCARRCRPTDARKTVPGLSLMKSIELPSQD
jgi:hypothetical protein